VVTLESSPAGSVDDCKGAVLVSRVLVLTVSVPTRLEVVPISGSMLELSVVGS